MDILGIGIPELAFIVVIALIVLGPRDMQKAGKTIGSWMRKVVMSPEWREVKDASTKLKRLPNQLMREANLGDFEQYKRDLNITLPEEIENLDVGAPYGSWSGSSAPKNAEPTNSIAPPAKAEPAPAKKADASPEASPVKNSSPIDKNNA